MAMRFADGKFVRELKIEQAHGGLLFLTLDLPHVSSTIPLDPRTEHQDEVYIHPNLVGRDFVVRNKGYDESPWEGKTPEEYFESSKPWEITCLSRDYDHYLEALYHICPRTGNKLFTLSWYGINRKTDSMPRFCLELHDFDLDFLK